MIDSSIRPRSEAPSRLKLVLAFIAVYIIWGSTYLAIRFAIETLPGFTMAGARFLIAGIVLYVWARARGVAHPTAVEWRNAIIIGALLLLGGNGLVVWAEHFVPSGWAALLVGTEPLFVTIILFILPNASGRPSGRTIAAIALGFVGVVVLTAPGAAEGGTGVHLGGAIAILLAATSWAAGSVYGQRATLPSSPRMTAAAQMLGGGALLALTGAGLGEWRSIDPASFSTTSILAFLYLIVAGSLVAFSAYIYLVRNVEPTMVATTAYVNPVVAVFLGWLLANEPLGLRTWTAMALIVGAVVLLSARRRPNRRAVDATPETQSKPIPAADDDHALERCAC